jgi:hypothetical protein
MYAQLMGIAREFNFPSTHGLCLYMHVADGGSFFLPRISAESWSILWSNLSEGSVPMPHTSPPISCRVEFDIDPTQALWYDSWVSASQKESVFLPAVPSSHHRRVGITTATGNDMKSGSSQQSTPILPRHVPKKLSLINTATTHTMPGQSELRVDTDSHSVSQLAHSALGSTDKLRTWEKSWPASASSRDPMIVIGQSSPHLENTQHLTNSTDESVQSQPKPNQDYDALSILSANPSSELNSPVSWTPATSVHLDSRTSSQCMSSSPQDHDSPPSIPSITCSPSPDTTIRVHREAPTTISASTSRDPQSSHLSSYPSVYRAPSPDLVDRGGWSCPVTPSTATSWNPIDFFQPLQASRGDTEDVAQESAAPSAPWKYCWPAFQPHPEITHRPSPSTLNSSLPQPASRDDISDIFRHETVEQSTPCKYCWPTFQPRPAKVYISSSSSLDSPPLQPASQDYTSDVAQTVCKQEMVEQSVLLTYSWPAFQSHPANPYPAQQTLPDNSGYPFFVICKSALDYLYHHLLIILDPATYPNFNIYPAIIPISDSHGSPILRRETVAPSSPWKYCWPGFQPHPANIYPSSSNPVDFSSPQPAGRDDNPDVAQAVFRQKIAAASPIPWKYCWPVFQPHPSSLYPSQQALSKNSGYPLFVICTSITITCYIFYSYLLDPATYPYFDIYPAVTPRNDGRASPILGQEIVAQSAPWRCCWPTFQAHPAIIYHSERASSKDSGYPLFVICKHLINYLSEYYSFLLDPATYPHFDIYPAITPRNDSCASPILGQETTAQSTPRRYCRPTFQAHSASLHHSQQAFSENSGYPLFVICKSVSD